MNGVASINKLMQNVRKVVLGRKTMQNMSKIIPSNNLI